MHTPDYQSTIRAMVYMESGYGHTQPIDEPDDESTRCGVGGDEVANRAMYWKAGCGG